MATPLINKEMKHPVPASKWPDGFLAKELVELTDGIIGAPTAYLIAKNIGDRYGRAYIIDKVKFFEWFLGMDNIYVQQMKKEDSEWTHDLPIPKGWEGGETIKLRMPEKKK